MVRYSYENRNLFQTVLNVYKICLPIDKILNTLRLQ